MSATDERLLAAITRAMQGPDPEGEEPRRSPSPGQSEDDEEKAKDEPTEVAQPTISDRRSGPQTGPKGVLADYRHSTQQQAQKEEETEEDKAFLEAYRAKRLADLQKPRPTFGWVKDIGQDEYVSIIDTTDPLIPVLIHLSDQANPASAALHTAMTQLASKYPHTLFTRIPAVEAYADVAQLDPISLPTLMVYRAGALIETWLRIGHGSEGIQVDDPDRVEAFLLQADVLA
ncbi:thioredoxin-like protein [Piptocephalis cylindrospora]|uniref:Thioredoxin-like protein n=1 Tax=Piptocephalis cylindrospora TaxID=1907219 RepID=A0A4P9XZG8_9FUNG|nr:thioredoxin-like protein [Piptocephalis cylindrospora]|eukprot:RKP11873.1 thioredoxin-like protein [Piptocephalis cylindrospora]